VIRWMRVVLPWQVAAIILAALLVALVPVLVNHYFHPAFNASYHAMLANTPWQPEKPLPLGPVQLVPQDALVLAILFGVLWLTGGEWLLYLAGFLATNGYLAMLAWTMIATRQPALFYLLAFAIGLCVFLMTTPWWIAVAAAAYAVVVSRLMHGFPWEGGAFGEWVLASQVRETRVGWPFHSMSPKVREFPAAFLWSHRGLLALVLGWWLFVIEHVFEMSPTPGSDRPTALKMGGFLIIVAALGRLAAYHIWFWTPIAWHARILTGRWILPQYDQVFIAPLLAAALWSGVAFGLPAAGIPERFAAPLAFVVAAYALLVCPPSLRKWRLTGHHRVLPIAFDSQTSRS
jgi:hypothetical protein